MGLPDLLQWFGGIGGTAALVFFLWGAFLKDPPLFVGWREFADLKRRHDRLLDLLLKFNTQAGEATTLTREALSIAKTTQGRGGSGAGRHPATTRRRSRAREPEDEEDMHTMIDRLLRRFRARGCKTAYTDNGGDNNESTTKRARTWTSESGGHGMATIRRYARW
jgi:hypothetical protein